MTFTDATRPVSTDPKLRLKRDTLRTLTDTDLRRVAGGSGSCPNQQAQ